MLEFVLDFIVASALSALIALLVFLVLIMFGFKWLIMFVDNTHWNNRAKLFLYLVDCHKPA